MRFKILFLSCFCLVFFNAGRVQAQCPVANSCTPGAAPAANVVFGMGIYSVTVGGASGFTNTTGGVTEGYQDYACTKKATVPEGTNTAIAITTNQNVNENVRVWIDLNNNGAFDAATELVFSSNNAKSHSGTFSIPVSAAVVKNTVLRMRIAADNYTSAIPGPCSTPVYSQTEDYGITVTVNTSKPTVAFSVDKPTTCSPTVQFTQLTQNGATSYLWNFGDNTTSTQANPGHTYAAPGTYNVKLKACNANGCDSLTKNSYITYHTNVPVTVSCTPATANYCCGYGITGVTFGTLTNTSLDGSAGYEDFTCTKSLTVQEGVLYPYALVTNATTQQDTWVYLDLNNNGTFETTELIHTKLSAINPAGNILIPGGAVKNVPLRLRIISDFVGSSANPCVARTHGQAEDYTLMVTPNTQKPAIAFTSNNTSPCDSIITFTESSLNAPTSWFWNFGDGTTSTLQNPVHKYTTAGIYPVKLKACNANGCDSLTKANYITFTKPCMQYCTPSSNSNNFWISNVTFNNINNNSVAATGGYANYTALSTNVIKGATYTISVNANGPMPRTTSVWIDYNRDGDFTDAGEQVLIGTTQGIFTRSFIILATAATGTTRMRVMSRNGNMPLGPCLINQMQLEAEDYNVVIAANTVVPVANFYTDKRTVCNQTVAFLDSSTNVITSWTWNFGDPNSGTANTTTVRNPIHTFSGPGVYTISLVACNSIGCNTITKAAYITVTGNNGPIGVSCAPATINPLVSQGIFNVTLNTINNNTVNNGYQDYSCSIQTTLTQGTSYPISVHNGTTVPENVRVYIDYNNNGTFNAATELVFSSNNKTLHTGTITPPATAVLNTPLRMRVISDQARNMNITPCTQPQNSQVEDYTVNLSLVNGFKESELTSRLSLYPNPNAGIFSLKLPAVSGGALKLEVQDLVGKTVAKQDLKPGQLLQEINLTQLPKGVYLLSVSNAEFHARKKVIIE
jgi:PKD repeat protein